jgi:hypothetical protein
VGIDDQEKCAFELLKANRSFPNAQVKIHEKTKAVMRDLSAQEPEFRTDARMELALRIFDIRSNVYLGLVTNVKSQEAFMTIVGEFARNAWEQYTRYPYDMLPPYPCVPPSNSKA